MKRVSLYVPQVDDLWFRQECMADEKTMEYNAGYDVSYSGYNYKTGCIDFPKSEHKCWFENKMKDQNFFYAYILDNEINKFVGYCNFKLVENGIATCGIVIKSEFRGKGYMKPAMIELIKQAKIKNVKTLTDTVPENRANALKCFYALGFKKTGEYISKKFNQDELVAKIELAIQK